MAENSSEQSAEVISQESYSPTPYVDSSWEQVGESPETQDFVPMGIELLPRTQTFVDPMFADYGGLAETGAGQRWHLPEDIAAQYQARVEAPELNEPDIPKIAMTEEELESLKQQSFMEGQQAGLEAAVAANAEKMAMTESRISQVMEDLQQQVYEHERTVEKRAVDLAMQLALKLTHQTVSVNPEYIVPIIQEALGLTGTARVKTVRVSAQDLEFINIVGLDRNIKDYDGSWNFVADDTVRNGCVVETTAGEIDFQLDPAWERIKDKVIKVL